MHYSHKLEQLLSSINFSSEKKLFFLQNNFSIMSFFLLLGFLTANLFGTIYNNVREVIMWDGLVTILLVIFLECISSFSYSPIRTRTEIRTGVLPSDTINRKYFRKPFAKVTGKTMTGVASFRHAIVPKAKNLLRQSANMFKLGLMVGFFVDAFKVGS